MVSSLRKLASHATIEIENVFTVQVNRESWSKFVEGQALTSGFCTEKLRMDTYSRPKSPLTYVSHLDLRTTENLRENDKTKIYHYKGSKWTQQVRLKSLQVRYFSFANFSRVPLLFCFRRSKSMVKVFSCQHPLPDGVRTQYIYHWEMPPSGTKQNSVKTVSVTKTIDCKKIFHFLISMHLITLAKLPVKWKQHFHRGYIRGYT